MRSPLAFAYATGPFSFALIWGLRTAGVIADLPVWVYAVAWIGPAGLSTAAVIAYQRTPSRAWLHARAATSTLTATAVVYATGWGPAMGVAYLVGAQLLVAATSVETWALARRWTLAGIAGGQIAIALGWAPSMLPSPGDNGVAALGFAGFLLVSRMAETIAADRERAREEVRASGERFRALVQSSSDLIVVMDTDGAALYVTGASLRILGLAADELRAVDLTSLVHPEDVERVRECFTAALEVHEPTPPIELRARHADGTWRHLEIIGTNLRDNRAVAGVVMNIRDVTDRKQAEAHLAHQAAHDALTGLPNRAFLLERLAAALQGSRGGERPSVLFMDVDRFKLINDSLGHDVGDQLLIEVARRLRQAVRTSDSVARFGGDEFVVVCEPPLDPITLARRLLQVLESPFVLAGDDYRVTASIGVATADDRTTSPIELIRDADTAMYRAKAMGRGVVHVFDDAARENAVSRAHTEHLLQGAIDRDELRLFYQPVVDLGSGAVVATEALLRWEHPQRGLVGPAEFIDSAEDSGLIVPIGRWVLGEACKQATMWARRGTPVGMSINVSARQLADDDFVAVVADTMATYRKLVDPTPPVTLEVTESVLIGDPRLAAERFAEVKALGLLLSMDDFGTGYSSLANLRRYPFDEFKIDRSFVAGISDSEDDRAIVRHVIALAQDLGRTIVAEGVETLDQLHTLESLGCYYAQGYYLGRPQPALRHPALLLRDDGVERWPCATPQRRSG